MTFVAKCQICKRSKLSKVKSVNLRRIIYMSTAKIIRGKIPIAQRVRSPLCLKKNPARERGLSKNSTREGPYTSHAFTGEPAFK